MFYMEQKKAHKNDTFLYARFSLIVVKSKMERKLRKEIYSSYGFSLPCLSRYEDYPLERNQSWKKIIFSNKSFLICVTFLWPSFLIFTTQRIRIGVLGSQFRVYPGSKLNGGFPLIWWEENWGVCAPQHQKHRKEEGIGFQALLLYPHPSIIPPPPTTALVLPRKGPENVI